METGGINDPGWLCSQRLDVLRARLWQQRPLISFPTHEMEIGKFLLAVPVVGQATVLPEPLMGKAITAVVPLDHATTRVLARLLIREN